MYLARKATPAIAPAANHQRGSSSRSALMMQSATASQASGCSESVVRSAPNSCSDAADEHGEAGEPAGVKPAAEQPRRRRRQRDQAARTAPARAAGRAASRTRPATAPRSTASAAAGRYSPRPDGVRRR